MNISSLRKNYHLSDKLYSNKAVLQYAKCYYGIKTGNKLTVMVPEISIFHGKIFSQLTAIAPFLHGATLLGSLDDECSLFFSRSRIDAKSIFGQAIESFPDLNYFSWLSNYIVLYVDKS